jgi:hypothetical protein
VEGLTASGHHGTMAHGVAYAEPPWIVPSTISDGGKGTSVSGRCPGPSVSGVVAGGSSLATWKAK